MPSCYAVDPHRSAWHFPCLFMKIHLVTSGLLALVLASCETGPLNTGGDFDPLTPPGSGLPTPVARKGYKPGTFVRSSIDNAAFFSKRPKGDADADKQLPANTEMKVISDDGSFVKVELDSGEVGFVPSVLVSDGSAAGVEPANVSPDAIQVYPPLPGGLPADPGAPTIPPVIDPDAPVIPDEAPLPDVPPVPDAPPVPDTPVELPPAPTPLPPGNEAE